MSLNIRCAATTGAAFAVVPVPTSGNLESAVFVFENGLTAARFQGLGKLVGKVEGRLERWA